MLFGITDHSNNDRLRRYSPANMDGKNSGLVFQRVRHILFRTSSCEYTIIKNILLFHLLHNIYLVLTVSFRLYTAYISLIYWINFS